METRRTVEQRDLAAGHDARELFVHWKEVDDLRPYGAKLSLLRHIKGSSSSLIPFSNCSSVSFATSQTSLSYPRCSLASLLSPSSLSPSLRLPHPPMWSAMIPPTTACCDSTEPADSKAGAALLSLLGIDLSDINVLLGLTCSPISVVGVGSGSACSGTTVSCSNGVVGGIGIGCVPITL